MKSEMFRELLQRNKALEEQFIRATDSAMQLLEIDKEHQRINGELREENKRLKNQNKSINEVYELTKKEYIRLNNIINELEMFLKEGTELATGCGITTEYIYAYENALDKLQELKGSDKE